MNRRKFKRSGPLKIVETQRNDHNYAWKLLSFRTALICVERERRVFQFMRKLPLKTESLIKSYSKTVLKY